MKISLAPARIALRISISSWFATAPSIRPGTVSSQLSTEVILVIGITYGVKLVDLTLGAAARQLLKIIEHVQHLPQPAVVAPVETEGNPRQVHRVRVFLFFRRRFNRVDSLSRHDVGEILVQGVDCRPGRGVVQADDEQVLDESNRMVV